MLVDTDILIWYLRGQKKAVDLIDNLSSFSISAVTHMEIVQGMRDKAELRAWKAFLRTRGISVLTIDQDVTARAMYWMEEYSLSHGLRLPDALIAATADVYGLELFTANVSDYKYLQGLALKAFRL